MPATRNLKSIADTLSGVRSDHRFLKVSSKEGGGFTVTRVQVSGQQTVWKKHPDVVYSPATGLAGRPHDVLEYLRHRDDNSDDSSAGVIQAFEADKSHWITPESYDDNHAVIEQLKLHRKAAAPTPKMTLVEPRQIPDLLQRVRDMRGQTPSSRVSKSDVIGTYLKVLEDDPSVRYRIHNCAADGSGLRKTNSASISGQSIPLSSDSNSHLSRFYIPSNYENRKFVSNFMTRYYMYEEKLRPADAATKAKTFAEDLLAPYKKAKKPAARGRSVSPKGGRSSSRSSSPRASSKKQTVDRSHSASTSKTVPRSRAASPKVTSHKDDGASQVARSSSPKKTTTRASRSKSPARQDSKSSHSEVKSPPHSASKSPPRSASKSPPRSASKSPSRSPSPSTSPKVAASKTLRLPKRK